MTQTVSVLSIVFMAVTAAATLLIPIAAFIYMAVKKKGKAINVIVGAGTFIVFALVLEQILHFIMTRALGEKLTGNIWIYALYGGLAAGLFEETGRLISMKLFMKKSLTKENAVIFGIGHGGAEAILIGAMTYFSNIIVSVMINLNMLDSMLTGIDEATKQQVIEQYSALWSTPSGQFLLAGIERILAFVLQLCLSYLIYRAVRYKKPVFYALALGIHFIIDAGLVVLAKFTSVYITEAIFAAAVFVLTIIIRNMYKSESNNSLT